MDTQIEQTLKSMRSRHIQGIFAEDYGEANGKILALIPPNAVVGIGDSTTIRQLGTLQPLLEKGAKILNPFERDKAKSEDFKELRVKIVRDATVCDVFLTGTNAVTQDGRIVNVDASGHRVAGMFWGHPLSIIVVGRNKIVKNLDEAFERVRKVIAPSHFRIRTGELGGRKRETPCVATGECSDCRSQDRGCNVFSVIEGKPLRTDLHVIIVNRDLGLGWDPTWPEERIQNIVAEYKKFVWVPK